MQFVTARRRRARPRQEETQMTTANPVESVIEILKGMTALELSELKKGIETTFGVTAAAPAAAAAGPAAAAAPAEAAEEKRSEEHTSELQSLRHLVCRL